MIKIAIVGSLERHFTDKQAKKTKNIIREILTYGDYFEDETKATKVDGIILYAMRSIHKGVADWAIEIADKLGNEKVVFDFLPQWHSTSRDGKSRETGFLEVASHIIDECDSVWLFEPEGDDDRTPTEQPESFLLSGGEYITKRMNKLDKQTNHWRIRML